MFRGSSALAMKPDCGALAGGACDYGMWANLQSLGENFQKAVIALLEMNIDFHQCDGIGGAGGGAGMDSVFNY